MRGRAAKVSDELAELRDFLVANAREVVILILEDYAAAPDIARRSRKRGSPPTSVEEAGAPWPTLGKMISSSRRLVVLSENQGGEPAWLLPAWEEFRTRPYSFENRGGVLVRRRTAARRVLGSSS